MPNISAWQGHHVGRGGMTVSAVFELATLRPRTGFVTSAQVIVVLLLSACQPAAVANAPSTSVEPQSPTPSAAPSSPPATVQASDSSDPAPSASAATKAPDMLPPGAEARVVVDSLQLRDEPGANAPIAATMPRDAIVYLAGPPFQRSVDGIEWRYVRYASGYAEWPVIPDAVMDMQSGWAATRDAEDRYLASEPIDCPPEPPDAATLTTMTDWAHVSCFGDHDLMVEGTVVTGFGGMTPGVFEPAWLAHPFALGGAISTPSGPFFYTLEGGGSAGYADGQRLRITGHYDDPAAATCTIASGEPPVPEPDSLAVAYCRAKFVATAIEVLED